jgi:hypothetical protein
MMKKCCRLSKGDSTILSGSPPLKDTFEELSSLEGPAPARMHRFALDELLKKGLAVEE